MLQSIVAGLLIVLLWSAPAVAEWHFYGPLPWFRECGVRFLGGLCLEASIAYTLGVWAWIVGISAGITKIVHWRIQQRLKSNPAASVGDLEIYIPFSKPLAALLLGVLMLGGLAIGILYNTYYPPSI
jgi:hypothetical protein